MDFPFARFHRPVIGTWSPEGITESLIRLNAGTAISPVSLAVSTVGLFHPFVLCAPFLVRQLWWVNGTTIAGNIDVGVYSGGANPALIVSAGATAQSGSQALVAVTLGTPVLLLPGSYYWACSASASGHLMGASSQARYGQALGQAIPNAANHPLAAVTLASISGSTSALMGMSHAAVL